MKKLTLLLVISFMSTITALGQKGFLGKTKALNLDINSLSIDRELELGLNFMLNYNINLIPTIGIIQYNSVRPYYSNWYSDSSYIGRRGFSAGVRILATTYLTGQVAPLGHYYGYGYKYANFTQIESQNKIGEQLAQQEQKLNAHEIYFFYGKSFLISELTYISIEVPLGYLWYRGYDSNISEFGAKKPRSYLGGNIAFYENEATRIFYVRPNLKLGFFF